MAQFCSSQLGWLRALPAGILRAPQTAWCCLLGGILGWRTVLMRIRPSALEPLEAAIGSHDPEIFHLLVPHTSEAGAARPIPVRPYRIFFTFRIIAVLMSDEGRWCVGPAGEIQCHRPGLERVLLAVGSGDRPDARCHALMVGESDLGCDDVTAYVVRHVEILELERAVSVRSQEHRGHNDNQDKRGRQQQYV